MREYLERFDEAGLQCLMVSQESILLVVQEGLRPSQFLHKISRKMPKTYAELKIKAFSHASADEYIKGKKGEPSRQKKDTKRKEQETTKDSQQKKSRLEGNQVLTRLQNCSPVGSTAILHSTPRGSKSSCKWKEETYSRTLV